MGSAGPVQREARHENGASISPDAVCLRRPVLGAERRMKIEVISCGAKPQQRVTVGVKDSEAGLHRACRRSRFRKCCPRGVNIDERLGCPEPDSGMSTCIPHLLVGRHSSNGRVFLAAHRMKVTIGGRRARPQGCVRDPVVVDHAALLIARHRPGNRTNSPARMQVHD